MKVYRFFPCSEIWTISKRKDSIHSTLVWHVLSQEVYPYLCGACLFPFGQSRATEQINDELHTFYIFTSRFWSLAGILSLGKMPAPRYPDALRQQVIDLYSQGKGYKAIGRQLGLSRDTVRNWIASYRLTGRTESVQTTGILRNGPAYQKKEERFAAVREEYESSSTSLLAIAQKHGLNYHNLRNYLQRHHPESALMHTFAKKSAQLQAMMEDQMNAIRQQGEEILAQMREELTSQLQRLQSTR